MYFVWANRRNSPKEMVIHGVPKVIDDGNINFDEGLRIEQEVSPIDIHLTRDAKGTMTDNLLAPGTRGLLFSSRLRQLLKKTGVGNIDYYPVRIFGAKKELLTKDYKLANLTALIPCVDFATSDLEMHPDDPDSIEAINSLTLNESRIKGALMFRLKEHSQIIVVHEKIKTACEAERMSGVQFFEPENFTL